MKKITLLLAVFIVLTSGCIYFWSRFLDNKKSSESSEVNEQENVFLDFTVSKKVYPVVYTIEQAKDILIVINKKHALPKDYEPAIIQFDGVRLRSEALIEYKNMINVAKKDGISLIPVSSYRSYADQEKLFNEYVQKDGQDKAETYSARAGHSEHQSGLAIDVGLPDGSCNLMTCMAETKEGKWLADNAHFYGYIIRYPEGKELETGYQYEPWHIRYVGKEVAVNIYESGLTMDAYFGMLAGGYAN